VYPQVRDFILQFNEGPQVAVDPAQRAATVTTLSARKARRDRSFG